MSAVFSLPYWGRHFIQKSYPCIGNCIGLLIKLVSHQITEYVYVCYSTTFLCTETYSSMASWTTWLVIGGGILLAIFLSGSRPSFSQAVNAWVKKGAYYTYKGNKIFYIGRLFHNIQFCLLNVL